MDARNRDLALWFTRIRTGQLQLPRFQRFEAWGTTEVADLLQTVIDGLPAGAVLVLEIGDRSPFNHRPLAGAPAPTERMTELILDGQQRLTSLWRALNQDYPDHEYFIDIQEVDADEDGQTDYRVLPQARWWRNNQRYPVWCDDAKQVLERGVIPARLLLPSNDKGWQSWLADATGGDQSKQWDLMQVVGASASA